MCEWGGCGAVGGSDACTPSLVKEFKSFSSSHYFRGLEGAPNEGLRLKNMLFTPQGSSSTHLRAILSFDHEDGALEGHGRSTNDGLQDLEDSLRGGGDKMQRMWDATTTPLMRPHIHLICQPEPLLKWPQLRHRHATAYPNLRQHVTTHYELGSPFQYFGYFR